MSDPYIDPNYKVSWYRTKLDPDLLAELNERDDRKGMLQAGGYALLIVATGCLAWWTWQNLPWPWMIPALIPHGGVSAFCPNAMHELVHGTVFKTKKLNSFFAGLFSFYYWMNHLAFWASHSEHHKYTLHDPHDQEVIVPMEITLKGFLRTLFIDLPAAKWILQLHLNLSRGKCNSSWGRYLYGDDPRRFTIFNWSRFVLAGHTLIFVVSILNGWWMLPVITSLTPVYGRALQMIMNESQHVGLQDHVDDFRLNSRTFRCNPLFRFVYWHMNWHIEHHMFAGVPCYNLHKLHKAVRHELPYVWKNIPEMWFHIITCLYRQKYEPGYVYIPELPGGERPRDLNATSGTARTESATSASTSTPELPDVGPDGAPWRLWECSVCGFVYDERLGLPEEDIAPGTRWDDIPDDWRCPDCGVAKADFDMVELKRSQGEAVATTFDVVAENGPVVIIGAGQAGVTLAREYRALNRKRDLILISADSGDFYGKPSLSNALAEGRTPEQLILKSATNLEEELNLTLLAECHVSHIDRDQKTLQTSHGEISYGKLVLATGSDAISLPLQGNAVDQVHRVNHLDQYRSFRKALTDGGHVAIIGAGLVGCEFANDLKSAGYAVTVLDPESTPLPRLLPPEVGTELQSALQNIGVEWRLGASVQSVDQGVTSPLTLQLSDGMSVDCDVVLSAVGIRPKTKLAEDSGLKVGKGLQVDVAMTTSDPDIFALGDCVEIDGQVLPYILPIMQAAKAIARSLAGERTDVEWPAMPVVVKTPAFPLVIMPGTENGTWHTEGNTPDLVVRQRTETGSLSGFVLSGDRTGDRQALLKEWEG